MSQQVEVIEGEVVSEELVTIDAKFKWIYDRYTVDGICVMEHSPLGASSIERVLSGCYGAVAANAGVKSRASEYAAEGTLAHSVAATLLRRYLNLPPDPEDVDCSVGSRHNVEGYEFEIDDKFLEDVWVYVAFVQEMIERYGLGTWGARIEESLHIPSPSGLLWGKGDAVLIVLFDRVIVIDLKFGRGKRVLADRNPQLRFYALAALRGISPDAQQDIREVDCYIVQPRHADGIPILRYTEGVGDLKIFEMELLAAEAQVTEDAPRKGGQWCEYCAAQGQCDAETEYLNNLTLTKLNEFPAVVLPQPINYYIEQSARIWAHKDHIEAWLLSHYKYLWQEMEAGRATSEQTGLKFAEKQTKRIFTDVEAAAKLVEEKFGISADKLKTEPKWKSPAQFEEAMKAQKREKKLDIKVKEIEQLLSPYTEKPRGERTLVSVTSSRKALQNTVVASESFDLTKVEGL